MQAQTDKELIRFLALFRDEIQNGFPRETITRYDLNRIVEQTIHNYLNGDEPSFSNKVVLLTRNDALR